MRTVLNLARLLVRQPQTRACGGFHSALRQFSRRSEFLSRRTEGEVNLLTVSRGVNGIMSVRSGGMFWANHFWSTI